MNLVEAGLEIRYAIEVRARGVGSLIVIDDIVTRLVLVGLRTPSGIDDICTTTSYKDIIAQTAGQFVGTGSADERVTVADTVIVAARHNERPIRFGATVER